MFRALNTSLSRFTHMPSWLVRRSSQQERVQNQDSGCYTICIEDILSWKDKRRTLCGFMLTYIGLWFGYLVVCQPYYVVSMMVLVASAHDAWYNFLWPEISLPGMATGSPLERLRFHVGDELKTHLCCIYQNIVEFKDWALNLRRKNHSLFCLIFSSLFLGCAGIGTILSGMWLAHCLFLLAWTTRLGGDLPLLQRMKEYQSFDELIPQLSDDELQVLESAKDATGSSANGEDIFHLSSAPTFEDLSNTSEASELHFVSSYYSEATMPDTDCCDSTLINEAMDPHYLDPLFNVIQRGGDAVQNSLANIAGRVMMERLVPSTETAYNEDFEIISDSDLEH